MSQETIERALKFPHFDWNDTLMKGEVQYPDAGVGLFHNPYPKEKKKKTKKGGRTRTKSPKKRK